jgi:hypothetical protein
MKETNIALFDELYYWMYFYTFQLEKIVSIYKPPESNPNKKYAGSVLFFGTIAVNYLSVREFFDYVHKSFGFTISESNMDLFFSMSLFLLGAFYVIYSYLKAGSIVAKCDRLPPERRIRGKIKFWPYIVLTVVMVWCADEYFHGN